MLSILIVSIRYSSDLKRCLNSIVEYSKNLKIQVVVVAHNYSVEILINDYDKILDLFVVSTSGFKGFSENNNIGFKYVKGDYVLILNDDTYFIDNTLEKLYNFISKNHTVNILSPILLNEDLTVQFNGRPRMHILRLFLSELKIHNLFSSSVAKDFIYYFQTFDISGACFMIKSDLFKSLGTFNEDYFFCPEDIELSQKAYQINEYSYVLKNTKVVHKGSSTAKEIHSLVIPVVKAGVYRYIENNHGILHSLLFRFFYLNIFIIKILFWSFKPTNISQKIMLFAYINCIKYSFSFDKPQNLFIKLLKDYQND